ncbi:MAG: NADH-quinone oxidoreductase subunit NuoK [Rhodospirillales bacterium]|nr:NADH-quinone oxidoreductase subunit NuoK [Rhodospirillales bacterium]
MTTVPIDQGLMLATVLFALGLAGVLIRRNLLFMLMSLEVMLNATGIAFIVAGARWAAPDGQIMFILVLTFAATEVSVGLALILLMHRRVVTLDADCSDHLRG